MSILHIQLLGPIQFFYAEQPITTLNKRRQSILAYLQLYRQQVHHREPFAAMLWPDTCDAQARTNLRKELMRLRHTLGALNLQHYVRDEHSILQWNNLLPYQLDIQCFEQSIELAEISLRTNDEQSTIDNLERAIKVYGDDLMTNVYDEWVLRPRQQFSDRYVLCLERIISLCKRKGDYSRAIYYARLLLDYNPLHEVSYRQLMELYASNGDYVNVKRTYQTCVEVLQSELSVNLSPLTQRTFHKIGLH